MNEKIKQLEPQCWEMTEFGLRFDYEKFAAFIITECRDIVDTVRATAIEDGWNIDEAMSTAMYDIDYLRE
jgi:hypothetical protein